MFPKISEILIKYKLKCLQCFPLFVHCWLLCCVYNSKVTIIITLEVACYFVSICSDIERTYNWNYSLKCRGLIKRTLLDLYRLYSSKLRIFCHPKHRTKSPPMEGPHTNVGTWAPSYLATLLLPPRHFSLKPASCC